MLSCHAFDFIATTAPVLNQPSIVQIMLAMVPGNASAICWESLCSTLFISDKMPQCQGM
jgi:hypothetical protein